MAEAPHRAPTALDAVPVECGSARLHACASRGTGRVASHNGPWPSVDDVISAGGTVGAAVPAPLDREAPPDVTWPRPRARRGPRGTGSGALPSGACSRGGARPSL
ncbi:hypothetical protein Shyhy01_33220 [Streptomyces hygroscopicus subsp. hygroscopicus]|nr:hypothetical protein Shyhy01_33220 [Streptomyces hygroscopicus subsp. hygroscopicus]